MTVERFGKSALGRDKFHVVINALDTKSQRRSSNWQKVRRYALDDPERAQDILAKVGDDVKVPLFIQGGIHGNEYEGVDAAMQVIERLALTPYGTDPEVDQILDQAIIVFNPFKTPTAGSRTARERERVRPQPRLPHAVAAGSPEHGRTHPGVAVAGTARSPRLRDADADRGDDEAAQPGHRVRHVAQVEPEPHRRQRGGDERAGLRGDPPDQRLVLGRRPSCRRDLHW